VHFNIKAFNCCKVITIPPFGTLIKKIKVASYRKHFILKQEQQEEMRFQKRQTGAIKRATFLPIIPLVRQVIPSTDKDKAAFITFELKVRAGTGTGTPSYKKFMKTFEEGSPQEWMDVLTGLKEIWKQNSVNGATDRAATISAILKGDSLTAFDTAMEDARVNPDPEEDDEESAAPLDMTNEMVENCLRSVTETVFPFRSLETQKQWMLRYMKKPFDLSSKSMMTSLNRINNYLPSFPQANAASKFSDSEIIGLMEFALPPAWRKAFDLKGYVPSDDDKARLVDECERIERHETPIAYGKNEEEDDNNNNNKNRKNRKFGNSGRGDKKNDEKRVAGGGQFFCKKCGPNATHDTDRCFILKKLAREKESNGKAYAKPYSKRTFRKEVNAIARRAGKNDGLKIVASALKRKQGKQEKHAKRVSKMRMHAAAKKPESDSDSSSSGSMHNMEMRIPRKKVVKQLRFNFSGFPNPTFPSAFQKKKPAKVKAVASKEKSIFYDLMDEDSEEEDEVMKDDSDNKATEEELAFLKSIDKEEKKAASKADQSDQESK
jgi:hypothetical protein